ncbi:uncharacterized protein V1510DRAFT_408767 [Dipodascopsis tothii]|uniref:uncharacterized protein n=1 Tax=Dipodascopsis tothii TaxID=44089 RepID=UPI0034CF45CF
METLRDQLTTLSDGSAAVALVLSNWNDILKAISLSAAHVSTLQPDAPADSDDDDAPHDRLDPLVRVRVAPE